MFEGRIYYCGHVETDAIAKLAAVGVGKKPKKCGETAYNRCNCGDRHPDVSGTSVGLNGADHPKFLCNEHLPLYED